MRSVLAVLTLGAGLALATSPAWAQFPAPQPFRVTLVEIPLGTTPETGTGAGPNDQQRAAPPQHAVIDPGRGIGPALLGMSANQLVHTLGEADFAKMNADGSFLYEWGLLSGGELPAALLWVVVGKNAAVTKVGTDVDKYHTSAGLRVGTLAEEFVKHYGRPANNPGPGLYVFPQGIGIAVETNGKVVAIWTEPGASSEPMRL